MRFIFAVLLLFLVFPKSTLAAYSGGINIGAKLNEMDQAAQAAQNGGWLYVMAGPTSIAEINLILAKYPNLNIIIRGHYPDSSLTSVQATQWAEALSEVNRPVYFVPINEPNNPNESRNSGGISAQTTISYITSLKTALANNPKVHLLSPAIDVFSLSDMGPSYIELIGGWNFMKQFDGIALNLYGQYKGGEVDYSAPPVKRGEGYREMFQSWGATQAEASVMPVYVVETGVIKVEDLAVRYKENIPEIKKWLAYIKPKWTADPQIKMFAIFSYDPAGDRNSWIYDSDVLTQMNLTSSRNENQAGEGSGGGSAGFGDLADLTASANARLLPKIIQDKNKEEETPDCIFSIPLLGCVINDDKAKLAKQTDRFQPIFVSSEKVITAKKDCQSLLCTITDFFVKLVPKQVSDKPSGSLNAFRPSEIEFNKINQMAANPQNSNILGVEDDQIKAAYDSTMCTILPAQFSDKCRISQKNQTSPEISPEASPVISPVISPSISPEISPYPNISALKDSVGSTALKNIISQVGQIYGVPPAVLASVTWIESRDNLWVRDNAYIEQYSQAGVKDPSWIVAAGAEKGRPGECRMNPCSAAGPLQFTQGTDAAVNYGYTWRDIWKDCKGIKNPAELLIRQFIKPTLYDVWGGFKNSVRDSGEAADQSREGIVCNIKDSIWGAGKKLKADSGTSGQSTVWNKQAVRNAGGAGGYYGACGACNSNADPELTDSRKDNYACNRLGMSYCEYMWLYYQCNENSQTPEQFMACIGNKRP